MVMLMSSTSSFSLLPLNPNLSPIFSPAKFNLSTDFQFRIISGRGIRHVVVRNSNQTAEVTSSPSSDSVTDLESASSVVRKFYGGINSRDLDSVEQLIAENCVYEDLVFPQPFVGRKVSYQTVLVVLSLMIITLSILIYVNVYSEDLSYSNAG